MNNNYTCIINTQYEKSLTIGALYTSLPDDCLKKTDLIRIIDNTGQNAIYPRKNFVIAT